MLVAFLQQTPVFLYTLALPRYWYLASPYVPSMPNSYNNCSLLNTLWGDFLHCACTFCGDYPRNGISAPPPPPHHHKNTQRCKGGLKRLHMKQMNICPQLP